ncbi:sensor histidine kinase [Streptomyces corynorhini]|uniref:histidine kinase n=1 Tax=Streptomyces corynorhini TaxID=2282652 RepID=A0A370BF71_9ACTN|nr:ATP-binding protein [Streptomyces corynorhini]RDG39039.1 sensor histidine kinase [Streptomyces corynorhini]
MRPSLRSTVPAALISAAVTGLLCVWAVSAAPASAQTPLAWGAGAGAAALTAAVTAAAHFRSLVERLRGREAAFTARAEQLAAKARRAEEDVRRTVADARRAAEDAARSEAVRTATVAACANAAGRVQAIATSVLADLRAMEHRHTDEDVLTDLLHLDHRAAQAGRIADSIAVLTGARSGRRWARPIVMESILRGAMGRISGYQRVRLHSTSQVAIAGHAAEGVMHALAELLDNAANFSPPTAEVHVYVEEVPAGVVVTVEDSGLVMSDIQLRRAERAVTAEKSDLSALSGTRLGLAVVGRLARKHGLTVSFRPSARGGTGALMMLPQELLTELRPGSPAPQPVGIAPPPAPVRARKASAVPRVPEQAAQSTEETEAEVVEEEVQEVQDAPNPPATTAATPTPTTATPTASDPPGADLGESGLPKRRRGRTLAAALLRTGEAKARARDEARPATAAPSTTPAAQAARFSSFRKAVTPTPVPPPPATSTPSEGDPR